VPALQTADLTNTHQPPFFMPSQ